MAGRGDVPLEKKKNSLVKTSHLANGVVMYSRVTGNGN